MDIYYSASTNMFYDGDLKESYKVGSGWPDDLVAVDNDTFTKFIQSPPDGKIRVAGKNGMPAWGDIPPPTPEDAMVLAEQRKVELHAAADAEISWRQDAVDTEMATTEEAAALIEWKKYRVLLMRVDTSKPEWPDKPE